MIAALAALALLVAPFNLDLPPEIDTTAVATAPAVRLDPPPPTVPTVPTFTDDCAEMAYYRAGVGLPAVFDRLGWRESNCRQELGVHTSCCWGWLQLDVSLHLRDHRLADKYHACGIYSRQDADGPEPIEKQRHMCAARALYDLEGLAPWQT